MVRSLAQTMEEHGTDGHWSSGKISHGAIGQLAHHLSLGDHHTVHGRHAVHLRNRSFALNDFHLNAKLIPRHDRTTKLRLIDRGQQHQFGLALRNRIEHQNPCHLRHRPDDHHARHNRNIGKMAAKKGSLMVTFLIPTTRSSSTSSMRSTSSIG
jgi:hypothetical protein